MADPPLLLIITGHPGSGKTTLAHRLAADFKLPLIYKDGIKMRCVKGRPTRSSFHMAKNITVFSQLETNSSPSSHSS